VRGLRPGAAPAHGRPEALFGDDYFYFSSYTQTVLDNAKANVEAALARFQPGPDALVVELASNDGYLLKQVAARGHRVLGIDPAPHPVEAARAAGVETIHAFFTEALAAGLEAEGRQASLVFASNVLAHVADTQDFVRGIRRLLRPDGTAIIEAPYLRDLVEHLEFDTIYHEHLCYFSVTALRELFGRQGLHLNDVERIPIHGGSLRIFVQKNDAPSERMLKMLERSAKPASTGRTPSRPSRRASPRLGRSCGTSSAGSGPRASASRATAPRRRARSC
jgi:SAM-dependent methyltransferase